VRTSHRLRRLKVRISSNSIIRSPAPICPLLRQCFANMASPFSSTIPHPATRYRLRTNWRFIISIPKAYIDKAHAQLDEHFIKADNRYLLKFSGARDRLKAFNFHDVHLTEAESYEELEVALSAEEKRCVIDFGRRLLGEAENVEKTQERVLFYYDSIEPLIERLDEPDTGSLSRSDLLAMLEIIQVYVDDPALPASMDEAISTLLGLFIG
jgi:hypothetical protein